MKYTLAFLLSVQTLFCFAQEAVKPRLSPLAVVSARYKNTYLKVTYSQPHKKGREIFGGVVPFGEVWRTGANEATELTVTKDIYLNGNLLKAGTYSVFSIPEKIKWTIIINSEPGLWGSYNYNQKLDVMRFDVPVQNLEEVYEPFTLRLDHNNDKADLSMMWDRTKVTIPIRFIDEP
jgi:hypothetical protein